MKLTILGGGGFRVPLVHRAVLLDEGSPKVTEIALYDPSRERLAVIESVLAQQAAGVDDPPRVLATTVLDEALGGADFVFSAIRVAGLAGRISDERVALRLGVLGQETTGPGGIAYGLRTVPVVRRIASHIAEICPNAYVINFTNPAGMITEAMQAVLGDRVVGICDTPAELGRRVCRLVGTSADLDYVGLNHLGWLRAVRTGDVDLLPGLLADDRVLSQLTEAEIFGGDWLRLLGAVPNEYLYYYYRTREAIAAIRGGPRTRGEFLLDQQSAFYAGITADTDPGEALASWERARAGRDATYMAEARGDAERDAADIAEGGYEGVAMAVFAALRGGRPVRLPLNVRNGSLLPGLPADAVVEVPCLVDAAGVHPLAVDPLGGHQLGLVAAVKEAERHAIAAASLRSPARARAALAVHPLVDSVTTAGFLFEQYRTRLPDLAVLFG